MHVHALGIAFRTIIGSAILEVADQFFLLRVNGDDGLLLGLRGNDFCVDVFELGVAVGMVRAFVRFAIELAREAELYQLLVHGVGADRMSHRGQGRRQLLQAFRHPDQRPHGIAQRRGLDQALEGRHEPRIVVAKRTTPAARAANVPFRQRVRVEIILAAIDRRTGKPRDLRDGRKTAPSGGPHLGRRKQPSSPLVELRADRLPSLPNRIRVDHTIELRPLAADRNPLHPSHSAA